jgi:hypothetical protein
MMQKRAEKRYAHMREVADALENWLRTHGYNFEPGSGDAAVKAALLTSGGPRGGRGPGSAASASGGSFGSHPGKGGLKRPKSPSTTEDTVYDKARDTKKDLDKAGQSNGGGSSAKRAAGKPLPKAKPLDEPGSDKKTASGAFPLSLDTSNKPKNTSGGIPTVNINTGKSGPIPALNTGKPATSGANPTVRSRSKTGAVPVVKSGAAAGAQAGSSKSSAASPVAAGGKTIAVEPWVLIAAGIGAAVVILALLLGILFATGVIHFGSSSTPSPRDRSTAQGGSLNTSTHRLISQRTLIDDELGAVQPAIQ